MLALLLATLAATRPPLAAVERDLVAVARTKGPAAAVRGSMATDAWLLDPELRPADTVLASRPEMLNADAPGALWWPSSRIITSCDGSLALATGGSAAAQFFTVWENQGEHEWRWVLHGPLAGADAASRPAAKPVDLVAACGQIKATGSDHLNAEPAAEASGTSGDGTLRWWLVRAADRDKRRLVIEYLTQTGWQTFEDATVG